MTEQGSERERPYGGLIEAEREEWRGKVAERDDRIEELEEDLANAKSGRDETIARLTEELRIARALTASEASPMGGSDFHGHPFEPRTFTFREVQALFLALGGSEQQLREALALVVSAHPVEPEPRCRCRFVDENGETSGHNPRCPALFRVCPDCKAERADYEGPFGAYLPTCPNCGSEAAPQVAQAVESEPCDLTNAKGATPRRGKEKE